jgi:hypothetical protein
VRDHVTHSGARWKLRTRPDAVPTMQLWDGDVTAWLAEGRAPGLVEIGNDALWVRGWTAYQDLRVRVREAMIVEEAFIPDGSTEREVIGVRGDTIEVAMSFPEGFLTVATLPCDQVGLDRRNVGAAALLPPAVGEIALRTKATIETPAGTFELGRFGYTGGSRVPDGLLATRHAPPRPGGPDVISVMICGGWVFGDVPRTGRLGRSSIQWGSNMRCPDSGQGVFVAHPVVHPTRVCSHAIPLYLRSATFLDHVGKLQPRAGFRVDRQDGPMTRISIPGAPVELMNGADWAVETDRIADCERVEPPPPTEIDPAVRARWPRIRPDGGTPPPPRAISGRRGSRHGDDATPSGHHPSALPLHGVRLERRLERQRRRRRR